VLRANAKSKGRHAIGRGLSYVDLSLFQVMVGLAYAVPKAVRRINKNVLLLLALRDRVAKRPGIKANLGSDRRIAFNEDGSFRRYPELDRRGGEGRGTPPRHPSQSRANASLCADVPRIFEKLPREFETRSRAR
jgi:hypothetical protein